MIKKKIYIQDLHKVDSATKVQNNKKNNKQQQNQCGKYTISRTFAGKVKQQSQISSTILRFWQYITLKREKKKKRNEACIS